jgi:hypothetical protein
MPIVLLLRTMIDEPVNRLMRDDATPVLSAQIAGDCFGRPARFQALVYMGPELCVSRELENGLISRQFVSVDRS